MACRRDAREGPWQVGVLIPAVDRESSTVDFRLSARRGVADSQGSTPLTITLDSYAALHRAVRELKADGQLPQDTQLRSSKY
jgi:hypothetical protein